MTQLKAAAGGAALAACGVIGLLNLEKIAERGTDAYAGGLLIGVIVTAIGAIICVVSLADMRGK